MPFEIKLSQLGGNRADYDAAVANHIAALVGHSRETGTPRPVAHPLVEAAIKIIKKPKHPDDFAADYVVIDDTPVATLDDKKRNVHAALVAAENQAKFKVLPERKVRLLTLQYSIAIAKPEEDRTVDDKEALKAFDYINKKWGEITLIGATAEAAIEELTEDTIDTWLPPNFG